MNLYKKVSLKKFDVVKNMKKFFLGSGALILAGILLFILIGFNTGIDFTGGTTLSIKIGETLETGTVYDDYVNQIETILEDNGLVLGLSQIEGTDTDASILIRYQDVAGSSEAEMEILTETVKADIISTLGVDEDNVQDAQRIGPSATASLLLNAFLAILIATILILIYIAFRFELLSGLCAILALVHDVLIMCSLVIIFQIEINSGFIAALITIIGYSINDTIVVFDRIRENRRKESYKNKTNKDIVNISIKETLVRTLNTSITTLFTITILAVLSVPSIREFAIPIIFGLIAGTYSSIFIATPLWAVINDKTKPRNKNAKSLKTVKEKKQDKITV